MSGKRIKALDGLRALAITEIVLYHLQVSVCGGMITRFVITFFFVLSGYLMAMHYNDTPPNWSGVKHIVNRRIAHFLPLYWLTLIAVLIFSAWGLRWDLPLHALLLQSFIPDSYYCFSYNEVAWFVSSLLVCYICFPMLNGIFKRVSLRDQIIMFFVIGGVYYLMLYALQPRGDYLYYICPATRMIDFALGMTLFRVMDEFSVKSKSLPMSRATVIEVLAILLAIACNILVYKIPNTLKMVQYTILWYLPVVMLIAVFSSQSTSKGVFTRLLSMSLLVKVGLLSMEIYILQYLTIGLVRKTVEALNLNLPAWLFIAVSLLVTLGAAIIAHRFITIPVKNWLSQNCKT